MNTKEKWYAAWDIAESIMSRSRVPLQIMKAPPCSGQYDCLALLPVGETFNSESLLLINLHGESDYQKQFEDKLTKLLLTMKFLHTSGHASIEDIRRVMTELNPKRIIPIHTLFPDDFLAFSDKVEVVMDGVEFEV